MIGVNDQISNICEDIVCSTAPTSAPATSRIGFFAQWGKRLSVAPFTNATSTASTIIFGGDCDSCDRCEDLKMQSDIKQSMLDQCATGLQAKEAEVEALKDTLAKLQAQLDTAGQANTEPRLEQVSFTCELQSKGSQLAGREGERIYDIC
ncbi:uncharacterized protein EKO05_0006337 [Ascochyta rabiei]|uniref:uncharacterized protein n=1 Tax=Didymella rabiei TaxID=5454 RepID=UPI0021FC4018|nr:uncharacterized protein EKO05_0006337 [Ascochyta rabiei]UPX15905.1 hypothetical protein EKO05_0006337 [Ascochyta rabiei]